MEAGTLDPQYSMGATIECTLVETNLPMSCCTRSTPVPIQPKRAARRLRAEPQVRQIKRWKPQRSESLARRGRSSLTCAIMVLPAVLVVLTVVLVRVGGNPDARDVRCRYREELRVKRIAALVIALTAMLATGGSAYATATADPTLTPGATDPTVTQANIHQTICTRGYTSTVRNVSTKTKSVVYAEYHISQSDKRRYVIDHLVPLEVGGSNDIRNLWPEPKTDAEQKDQTENLLHARVCSGTIDLATAQQLFETYWSPGSTPPR